jgi:hypothetical protein
MVDYNIIELIEIRQYIINVINSVEKSKVNYLNSIVPLINVKIVNLLESDDFKNLIGYEDIKSSPEYIRRLNDINSGLKK